MRKENMFIIIQMSKLLSWDMSKLIGIAYACGALFAFGALLHWFNWCFLCFPLGDVVYKWFTSDEGISEDITGKYKSILLTMNIVIESSEFTKFLPQVIFFFIVRISQFIEEILRGGG